MRLCDPITINYRISYILWPEKELLRLRFATSLPCIVFSSIDLLKNGVDATPGWNGCNVTNNPALNQLSHLTVARVSLF